MKENSKNKKVIMGILVVVVLVLAIGMVAFALNNSPTKKLQNQLALGQKYLQELDYDHAIAAFEAAIEIDPMCVEAYLGLAEVYVAMENYDSALEILQKGYELTGDARLKVEIDRINTILTELANATAEEVETEIEEVEEVEYDFDFTFTTSMIEFEAIGLSILEITKEKMWEHATTQMSVLNEFYHVGDGYALFIDAEDSYRLIDNSASISVHNEENNRWVNVLYGEAWNNISSMNGVELMDKAIIHEQIIGKTYEEFFNGIADGLYEALKPAPENEESIDYVLFKNGYAYNASKIASGTIGSDEITQNWLIIYKEDGKEIHLRIESISEEERIDSYDITIYERIFSPWLTFMEN